MPGITRAAVLELARTYDIPTKEAAVEPAILLEAEEVFITNSVRGVVPVHAIGDRMFEAPGAEEQIAQWYWQLVEREAGPRWP